MAVISGDRGLIPNPSEALPLPGAGRNIPLGRTAGDSASAAGLGSSQERGDTVLAWEKAA